MGFLKGDFVAKFETTERTTNRTACDLIKAAKRFYPGNVPPSNRRDADLRDDPYAQARFSILTLPDCALDHPTDFIEFMAEALGEPRHTRLVAITNHNNDSLVTKAIEYRIARQGVADLGIFEEAIEALDCIKGLIFVPKSPESRRSWIASLSPEDAALYEQRRFAAARMRRYAGI